VLSREQELDLTGMTWHWGEVYSIAMQDGTGRATWRADPEAVLTANSADGLREMIRADYFQRTAKGSPLLGERMST
jgi:Zn-dependent oligopeptidase